MKNSQVGPRRDSAHNVTVLDRRVAPITQLRLARIQQLQSDSADTGGRLREELKQLRKDIMAGAAIEHGPIRVFTRKKGRKKYLVIK